MRPSVAFEKNRALVRDLVARHNVVNPRIFGSVRHGTDTEDSDVDILVDALPTTTLVDLSGLQLELEALLGVGVDVATPNGLSEYIRDEVLSEALPL